MRSFLTLFFLGLACLLPVATPAVANAQHDLTGIASWYGGKFHGRLTANGETFDTNQMTAAHRTLPFGTIVRVVNETNAKSVVVRINDRGPFVDNRVIDLSRAAADAIEMTAAGIAPVRIEILHLQRESELRTVQVGSYSRRAGAEEVIVRLRQHGLDATLEPVPTAGVHRVIVQGVHLNEIETVRTQLARLGHPNVLVRQK